MKQKEFETDVYVVDNEYRLVYVNENVEKNYPEAKKGQCCYKALTGGSVPCEHCLLRNKDSDNPVTHYDKIRNAWMMSIFSETTLKEYGGCYTVMSTEIKKEKLGLAYGDVNDKEKEDKLDIIENLSNKLIKHNELLDTLISNMPSGYHRCAVEKDYPFIYISKRFAEMLGYKIEEIEQEFDNKFMNMVHPDDRNMVEDYAEVLESDNNYEEFYEEIYRLKGKDGYRWVIDATRLINNSGEQFYVGSIVDITPFVEKEKLLSDGLYEKLRLIQVLCSEYEIIYLVNIDNGTCVPYALSDKIKKEHKSMSKNKVDFNMLYNKYIEKGIHEEDREKVRQLADFDNVREELSKKDYLYINYRSIYNGVVEHYQLRIVRLSIEGEPLEVAWAYRNMEEIVQKEIEQKRILENALKYANNASNAKSTFLSNMSHDIRTPMNAIVGFTELAKSHIDDAEMAKEYLNKISSSSNHLLSLINDILDMSRIESGKVNINENKENLFEIINEIRTMTQSQIDEKHITFKVDFSDVKNEMVYCDKLRLNQVLINIIGNAIKYSDVGGYVELRVLQKLSNNSEYSNYEFHIKDNGKGINKEFLDKIFEPFEREKETTISGIQGTGLGLAISKNIIDMMNGTINIESEVNRGSEFIVNVPLRLQSTEEKEQSIIEGILDLDKNKETKKDENVNIESRRSQIMKILLVEDNELNQQIAYELLTEEGVEVHVAGNGLVATKIIEKSREGDFDVILMDIQMPVMDGYTATKEIRKMDCPLSNIPIIAMTANAFEEDKKKSIEAGMNGHISKPFNVKEVISTITKIIGE